MLVWKLPHIIFRNYHSIGYLTDNRNYGYDSASKSSVKLGERIVSKSASELISLLDFNPTPFESVLRLFSNLYPTVPIDELGADIMEIFKSLSQDGFLGFGEEYVDYHRQNLFSYKNIRPYLIEEELSNDDKPTEINEKDFNLNRIHLSITSVCNERCVHCYFPISTQVPFLDKSLFDSILKQCLESNILNITISGGEPLLNPNLKYFLKKCKESNISINLLSNLTLLDNELLGILEKMPLLSVQTSLYSMSPEIHDSVTGIPGSFIKTKKAIEVLHEMDIPMQINCPVMKQNQHSYREVVEWANSLNIEASADYMLFGKTDGSKENLGCRLNIDEVGAYINSQSDNEPIENPISSLSDESICPVCKSSLCVSASGYVYPCEGWQSLVLGNIKTQSLSEIWNQSSEVEALRALTLDKFPKCRSCSVSDFCNVCLIRNVNESANLSPTEVNPYFCSIAKIRKNRSKRRPI